jgi:Domain of unknown function (DU1801)
VTAMPRRHSASARANPSPAKQLASVLDKYDPAIAARARASIAFLRKHLPTATELVYDNYNALAIGFGPDVRPSEAILSIAVYPRWVSLFFLQGATLPDPERRLRGHGSRVRHIVLNDARELHLPAVEALISAALATAKKPLDPNARRSLIIKSVAAKQRPRRPSR